MQGKKIMSYVQQLRMEKEQMLVISGPIYIFQPQKSYSGHVYSFLNFFCFFFGGGGGEAGILANLL